MRINESKRRRLLKMRYPSLPVHLRSDYARLKRAIEVLLTRHPADYVLKLLYVTALNIFADLPVKSSPQQEALLRARARRVALDEAEGGSISVEEARYRLGGISKQTVLNRYKAHRLVGWRSIRQNAVRLPVWQFKKSGVLPGLADVVKALRGSGKLKDRDVLAFFLRPRRSLGGRRPIDALRKGKVQPVLTAARRLAGKPMSVTSSDSVAAADPRNIRAALA